MAGTAAKRWTSLAISPVQTARNCAPCETFSRCPTTFRAVAPPPISPRQTYSYHSTASQSSATRQRPKQSSSLFLALNPRANARVPENYATELDEDGATVSLSAPFHHPCYRHRRHLPPS